MASGTITFATGMKRTCRFLSVEESPWIGTQDPPWVRGPHPTWPQYQVYSPIPGVEHRRIVRQAFFGTVYDAAEWDRYYRRGYI